MIKPEKIAQIELLAQHGLGHRLIAEVVGVSKSSVSAIAAGKRRLKPRRPRIDEPEQLGEGGHHQGSAKHARCATCGRLVLLPCIACQAQAERDRQPGRRQPDEHLVQLRFDLKPEHEARYQQVHAQRLANPEAPR